MRPSLPLGHTWLVGPAGWHLVFLAGVIVTAGGLALARDDRRAWKALPLGAVAIALGLAVGL